MEEDFENFYKIKNWELAEELADEERQREIKKLQDIKNFNQVWAQDIKIKEIQNEINRNLKNFNT